MDNPKDIEKNEKNNIIEVDEKNEGKNVILSRHTISEKHSLNYDTIFKGKKEDQLDEDSLDGSSMYFNETFEVDKSSNYHTESIENENYVGNKILKDRIYEILTTKTGIEFIDENGKPTSRRKPAKVDFNKYYAILRHELRDSSYSHVEVFVELSSYFSDNLVTMLRLLDMEWSNLITVELKEYVGKTVTSGEVVNRNLYTNTEVEFEHYIDGEFKLITGIIIECDYINSMFKINSFEREYTISIDNITKIISNNKYRNNISKLNNIDFL